MTQKTIVVIGNGMVGCKFIEKLTDLDTNKTYKIVTFCEEPRPAYDRVHLSEYFNGKSAADLELEPLSWYEERGVDLYLGERVVALDRSNKTVISSTGKFLLYHAVVLATGSSAFVPPIPGVENDGVFVYRTIEDLEQMQAWGEKPDVNRAAVIGGGLLGLEAANALLGMKLETHVVEIADRLMPRQVDDMGSQFLAKKIADIGVTTHLGKMTSEFAGNGRVTGMNFADDSALDVDMVVISAGIRPRDELAQEADLAVGKRGGIVVNDLMQTSDPAIYAIGECALHDGMIYGLVAPGYRMAETAANHLMGVSMPFAGSDMSTKLKLLGVDVASVGNAFANGQTEMVTFADSREGVYKKLLFNPATNLLEGAILVGDADEYGTLLQMYLNEMPLPDKPETLIVQGGESAALGIDKLPDSAIICSCENVTKAEIACAVQDGQMSVPEIKKCTKAGTGCSSCIGLVKDIIKSEMGKMGLEVDKAICEHFAYTRQELVQLIRVGKIETFDEMLGRFGTGGDGCETCKPIVASILATYKNEYILEHQMLQDTNDYYLANIQKNGSYSVVPRVPGGEITPEQLIAIGQVAQEFDLYTKITGGQRIDLFGAELSQLPPIWAKLNAVGLESGHAYAKGLRTVKSCVGETWCRFGLHDSVGLAIALENRYKGIRFPHKVKMAVSGCARECAEAQSKDVGVIATDKGWNLYVCGNGGMKPRHADLLAVDISREEVVRYTDRFLMYYARTADHLTRTAKWMDALPGGVDHLREIVIDDKFGIGDELEQEMQYLVSTYQDEWATTVADPEKRKRYNHFVNTAEPDPLLAFAPERGQKKPLIMLPMAGD